MNRTIIISGSNGFVGNILANYFSIQGWRVLEANRTNHSNHIFFDLDYPEQIATYQLNEKVDTFLHIAASHEITCQTDPYKCISRNVIGTKAALDFSVNNNIDKFIYISTFHVFGNPIGKISELDTPLPFNDYGLSHLQAEQYVSMYARQDRLKTMIIRPTNLFGMPSELNDFRRWTLTPFSFCKSAITKDEIVLKTTGEQLRNFLSINELGKIIELSIDQIDRFPLLHCYGPDTLRIKQLADLVKDIMSEQFNRQINVVIPKQINQFNKPREYQFESNYLNLIYEPTQTISNFLSTLCHELIKKTD